MKAVLDTNVFISAFLWQKNAKEIFTLAKDGVIEICATREILEEYQRVLYYPKFQSRLALIQQTPEEIIDELLEIIKLYPSKKFASTIVDDTQSVRYTN